MKKTIPYILLVFLASIIVYSSCSSYPEKKEYTPEEKELLAVGKEVAEASFMVLSSKLKNALAEGGVPKAIPYCKEVATSITDSLSREYGFEISRTALKVRNPENKADKIDEVVMTALDNLVRAGKDVEPILLTLKESNQRRAYYPILIKPMCKSCHGIVSKEISEENYELILEQYPNDEAVNFFDGSLRGAWKVLFPLEDEEG